MPMLAAVDRTPAGSFSGSSKRARRAHVTKDHQPHPGFGHSRARRWFTDIAAACCAPDGLDRAPVDSRHAMINPWNAPVRLNVVSGLGAEIGPAQSTRRAASPPPFRRTADLQSGRMLDAPGT
jgi:hypothetical protein